MPLAEADRPVSDGALVPFVATGRAACDIVGGDDRRIIEPQRLVVDAERISPVRHRLDPESSGRGAKAPEAARMLKKDGFHDRS